MGKPKVCVITPSHNRPEMLYRCIDNYCKQDYDSKEMTIIHSGDNEPVGNWENVYLATMMGSTSIGQKRNAAIRFAIDFSNSHVDIILHMDDDDLYAPDWITRSVEALINSKADIVGLSNSYFQKGNDVYEYRNDKNSQLYLCGATLCYWRKTWERKPFPEVTKFKNGAGEDTEFISNNGRLHCHGYKDGFLATIHGNNTCSHRAIPNMKKLHPVDAADIIKRFY